MADPRFAALSTDPRYRIPSRKKSRTAVDTRFQGLFKSNDFRQKASVDRYGRKIKPDESKQDVKKRFKLDRGDVKLDKRFDRDVVGSSDEESEDDEDLVEDVAVKKKDPAREGGFSESESDEESSSDDASDDEAELAKETAGQEQTEQIPMGEVSRRIAAVNLDWDKLRASDILAVASSFVPVDGKIESVTIYPSEFGKERMQREELEGPPREIFTSSKRDPDELDEDEVSGSESGEEDKKIEQRLQEEQINEGEEFDTAKLRQYQLDRLRYYYAVISCTNKQTAKALYDSMDGREYLSSSNFFDLRFVPDDVSFEDDTPRDECTKLPEGYKPNDFRTEALTHSKVRLTWDDDDTTRKEVQKRAFSRAEIDENDLQAYIGSDSSDADSVASRKSVAEDRKAKKREAQRSKMRAALGLAQEAAVSGAGGKAAKPEVTGDMQITFTSGLGGDSGKGVFENEPQDEESTRARYIRKERERKQKRKEKMKASRTDVTEEADGSEEVADEGFNDPFFMDPAAAKDAEKKAKKVERKKKEAARAAQDEEAASRRAELELLMAADQADNLKHFDMREIEKAEKEKRKKGKKGKKKPGNVDAEAVQEEFKVETEDPRFKALFESHEYAIDPTNPRFKSTSGMKQILEEGRRKRKVEDVDEGGHDRAVSKSAALTADANDELNGLVKRLKKSSKTT